MLKYTAVSYAAYAGDLQVYRAASRGLAARSVVQFADGGQIGEGRMTSGHATCLSGETPRPVGSG